MYKPPITPWTPPIRIPTPKPPKKQEPETNPPSGGGSGGSGQTAPKIPTIEELFTQMLEKYLPETVEFTPLSEDVLSETIKNWLRPAYEQAIASRREQTGRINAELDADAWSRGMGSSTYLSDVKERQYRSEERDVDALESNYAATLAGRLYDAMKEQQEKKIEVDEFNATEINRAREKAMAAAQALYQSYLSGARSHGHSSGADADETETEQPTLSETLFANFGQEQPKVTYRTAANILARMSPKERTRLFNATDPAYRELRGELIYGLGRGGFAKLMRDFPA